MADADAWNFGTTEFSSTIANGWDEDNSVVQLYRDENALLKEENELLKRKLAMAEQHAEQLQRRWDMVSHDLAMQRPITPRPTTPTEPISALEEAAKRIFRERMRFDAPNVPNVERFIPPRYRVSPKSAVRSPTPVPEVQKEDDDELFQSLKTAYERGCAEAGLPH